MSTLARWVPGGQPITESVGATEFWNGRYDTKDSVFGTEPNAFLINYVLTVREFGILATQFAFNIVSLAAHMGNRQVNQSFSCWSVSVRT